MNALTQTKIHIQTETELFADQEILSNPENFLN